MSARWISCLILGLLVGAGAVLRFAYLTSKPFWFDECFSVELARLNWTDFLHVIWWREANMILYYILLRGWLHFGQSEFLIRTLSAVFAVATIPAMYWLTRQFFDRGVAFVAAALFTFNAYNVCYAQEARSYALFVLLVVLSSGFLLAWVREPIRRNRLAFMATSILAMYAHLYALLLLAAQWLALCCFGRPDSTNQASGESDERLRQAWKVIAVGALPLLIFVAKTGAGPIRWVHRPGIHDLLNFWKQISGGSSWPLPLIYFLLCLAALAPLGKRLLRPDQSREVWAYHFLLVWLLFPVLLTFFLSFLRPVFLARFLMFCQPALIMLTAVGIARLRKAWLLMPALAAVLLLALHGVFFVYGHGYENQPDGSGAATEFILDHTQPGDGIIFHIAEARVPYEFFRSLRAGTNTASPSFHREIGPEILFPDDRPGLDFNDFKAALSSDFLREIVPTHSRVWVMYMYNDGPGPMHTNELLVKMLPEWFPARQCWQFPKVEICLYHRN